MAGRLAGKVCVVTGAASGLGEATARLMHAEGASVLLADIQDGRGRRVAAELGDRRAGRPFDLGQFGDRLMLEELPR